MPRENWFLPGHVHLFLFFSSLFVACFCFAFLSSFVFLFFFPCFRNLYFSGGPRCQCCFAVFARVSSEHPQKKRSEHPWDVPFKFDGGFGTDFADFGMRDESSDLEDEGSGMEEELSESGMGGWKMGAQCCRGRN